MRGVHRACRCFHSRETNRQEKTKVGNMATRSVFRSLWTSFAGLNLGGTGSSVSVLQRIRGPQLSALTIQRRGIRQGEAVIKRDGF